ncbi:GH3 auxin-responsive promoter family protein [Psychroflexus salinarum]|uniref:GH3 auxin-responsive promoter family protein n=1 Tax=Psychroflexus salinarum TaxID=546024 RepID=A0ABW3GRV2_9FLAO
MPIPIVNSIASWILKKRIHHMELFKKHPNEVQNELLLDLVYKAQNTEFGKTYGFDEIKSYETFKERVPVQTYEDFEATFERCRQGEKNIIWPSPITMFAKSSGTTGSKSKFIPVSQESLEDCHYAASKDLLCMYLNNNPDSKLFTGKSLRLGGSKEIYQDKGTSYGDLSALLIYNMPFWASYSSTPGNSVSLMSDWETKMQAIVDETIKERVTSLAGVPSWMLVLLNDVLKTSGKSTIDEVWPDLEVYFHGGVSFEPYVNQYEHIIPSSKMRYYEIYNASEGFFAAQDLNDSKDLLLMLDYGIFFEFIPMSTYGTPKEKVISLSEVEIDENYAIVISTNSGLWRYKIGDTVRFTSLDPFRIRVTGRTKHHINAFGEELIIENAEAAIKKTACELNCEVMEYTAAPVFMNGKKKGAHEWILEFKTPPENLSDFQIRLDKNLQEINSDYEAKRYNNMTLDLLKIHQAKPKLFQNWLKHHNKLGGQHKIPRLSNNREHLEELLALNEN